MEGIISWAGCPDSVNNGRKQEAKRVLVSPFLFLDSLDGNQHPHLLLPPQMRDTPITMAFLFFPIMVDYTLKLRTKISLLSKSLCLLLHHMTSKITNTESKVEATMCATSSWVSLQLHVTVFYWTVTNYSREEGSGMQWPGIAQFQLGGCPSLQICT